MFKSILTWRCGDLTNRKKIMNESLGDYLVEVQKNLDKFNICIMHILPGGRKFCPMNDPSCDECLRDWLNEETK